MLIQVVHSPEHSGRTRGPALIVSALGEWEWGAGELSPSAVQLSELFGSVVLSLFSLFFNQEQAMALH